MSDHASQIDLFDLAPLELRLQQSGDVLGAREQHDAARVGIQTMRGTRVVRPIDHLQNVLKRVAVEPTTRVHRQRSGFVNDDDRFVFVQDADVSVDFGFDRFGLSL